MHWLWVGCGKDNFRFGRNNDFVDWLKTTGINHSYAVTEGAHTWEVWRDYLAMVPKGLFKNRKCIGFNNQCSKLPSVAWRGRREGYWRSLEERGGSRDH